MLSAYYIHESKIITNARRIMEGHFVNNKRLVDYEANYRNLSVAFPRNSKGNMYNIEVSDNRKIWRYFLSMQTYFSKKDPLKHYAICKSQIATFEIVSMRENPDEQLIYEDGRMIAKCIAIKKEKMLWHEFPVKWEIFIGNELFATIEGKRKYETKLSFKTREFHELNFDLIIRTTFSDFLVAFKRFVTLAFLYSDPPRNRNYILGPDLTKKLSHKHVKALFMIVLLFRTFYLPLDFTSSD